MSVVVGAHEIDTDESSQQRHRVLEAVIHEKYASLKPRYDILLLRVGLDIEFDERTRPICVDASVFPTGARCMVTGWGSTANVGTDDSYVEMGRNPNPARAKRTRTQVLPRTEPNGNRKAKKCARTRPDPNKTEQNRTEPESYVYRTVTERERNF